MSSVLLTHARFQRPPVVQKRRRGRLPGIVTWIPTNGYDRLREGALGELAFGKSDPDNGKRVRIVNIDLRDSCPVHVAALNGSLHCEDGSKTPDLWVKPHHVRRVWTGLTENERIRLRLSRGAS